MLFASKPIFIASFWALDHITEKIRVAQIFDTNFNLGNFATVTRNNTGSVPRKTINGIISPACDKQWAEIKNKNSPQQRQPQLSWGTHSHFWGSMFYLATIRGNEFMNRDKL